jgi:hypothetical protein
MVKERMYHYVYSKSLQLNQNNLDRTTYFPKKFVLRIVFSSSRLPFSLPSSLPFNFSLQKPSFLAGSDEKAQRRRVVVLEEVQAQTILG